MERSKAISRLRKLLALARSGDSHEAASARRKAGAFMLRHGLREKDADEVSEYDVVEASLGSEGFEQAWKFRLATFAARRCRCEAVGLCVRGRRKVRLVGLRDDVRDAAELFAHLDGELREIARAEMRVVVADLRRQSRYGVRRRAEDYLRWWREGAVDGLAHASAWERSGGVVGGKAAPVVSPGKARVEAEAGAGALVRSTAAGQGVRDRVARFGARQVHEVEEDEELSSDFDEYAYDDGFKQGCRLKFPGKGVGDVG